MSCVDVRKLYKKNFLAKVRKTMFSISSQGCFFSVI